MKISTPKAPSLNVPTLGPGYRKAAALFITSAAIAGAITVILYLSETIAPDAASSTAGTITGLLAGGIPGLFAIQWLENAAQHRLTP